MELTIPAAAERAARDFGDAPALTEPGGPRLSWRELHERASVVARAFMAGGVQAGDRVAIWSPNTHHWVTGALGALRAGAVLVPVSTRFTGPEALDVITRSGARALLVAGPFLGTDRLAALYVAAAGANPVNLTEPGSSTRGGSSPGPGGLSRLPASGAEPTSTANLGSSTSPGGSRGLPANLELIVSVPVPDPGSAGAPAPAGGGVLSWDGFLATAVRVSPAAAAVRAAAVGPDDLSDILFTSGTTGRSKGAMTAHRRSLAVARAWAECGGLYPGDRYLVVNPFFHSFGFKAGILACLVSGAAIVPQLVYDAGQAMALVAAERITVFPGPPTIYQTILDHPDRAAHDLSSLRLAVTGAATVPVALVERMQRELSFETVLTAYGLTEAVVATMCRPGDDPERVASTSGQAAAGFEVRIAGPDGAPRPAGKAGEILLRGPNVMLGYLDDPAATREAIDPGGWLHTGDIGHLDPDGYLTITDRLKDMYICGGFNVYPAEVEQVLARLEGVAEAAVVGVPDGRLGEVGRAYLVPGPGCTLDAEAVLAWCRPRLANYKLPRQVVFRDSLPRNPSGKTLKRLLREEPA
jgi:acyl-CoA synthetase (AMP-forming)/AMP-acid ligase II